MSSKGKSCGCGEGRKPALPQGKPVLTAVAVGAGIILLLMALVALGMTFWDLPVQLISPIASLILVAGSWAAGYLCARMTHRKGLLSGAVCGVLLFLLVLAAGCVNLPESPGPALVLKLVMILTGAMAGGVMGVNKQVRGRR